MNDALRIDAYIALASGAQAMRRHVEAADAALGGALGVAAEPYPHQIAAVRRVLTDTRVRHLIADEVGLGKTVQALMILNALRWQNPRHKALVLVPNRLIDQWRRECWTRGHCKVSVFGDDAEDERDAWVRIIRPQSIRTGDFRLQPDRFDLLIVDEPQLMPVEVMDVVERTAAEFRQLLILSATPGLGDPDRRRRLMAMLEPERAALADAQGEGLLSWIDRIDAEGGAGRAPTVTPGTIYQAFSSERRIMRATRAEWGRYLPQRRYERVDVEPLASERERISLGMQWLESVRRAGARTDVWRTAQVLHRGTPSVRGVASGQDDRDGLLARAVAASTETPGDSRLDALLDILGRVWGEDAAQQVIIVAGDNPTIDFLKARLPRYFRFGCEPVGISELRREGEASASEEADIRTMDKQLADFTSGRSKLLLLGEWVQAGINLHYYARDIVFYTTPWSCDAVDQLIGRLDRLRPNGLWRGDRGKHFGRIRIWSVSHRGTAEQKAVSGLEALRVFDRPLPPLGPEEAEAIERNLKSLVFSGDSDATARLARAARSWDESGNNSTLAHLSPFTPASAQSAYDTLQARALPGPVLRERSDGDTFTSACEKAFRGWLDLIRKSEIFAIDHRLDRFDRNIKFMTLWYRSKQARYEPFEVSGLEGGNAMEGHVPFIIERRRLSQPLKMTVVSDAGEEGGRPLRFLDHGDEVHDSLVAGSLLSTPSLCPSHPVNAVQVAFDPGHPLLMTCSGKILMLAAAFVDPGRQFMPELDRTAIATLANRAPTDAQHAALTADVQTAIDWWLADQRWLRANFPSGSYFSAALLDGARWVALPEEIARQAFMPMTGDRESRCARIRGPSPRVAEDVVRTGSRFAVARLNDAWREERDAARPVFAELLERRLELIGVECADFIDAREAALEQQRTGSMAGQEWAREGRIAAAQRSLEMASTMVAMRKGWLASIAGGLGQTMPIAVGTLMIRPAAFADDF